jgi:hypothetical protein
MASMAGVGRGSVVSLWRYPLKSMMGEELNGAGITERGLLGETFDRFAVPEPEQDELKAIVGSTKESIVVRPFQEGPEEPVGAAGGGGARRPPVDAPRSGA